MLLALGLSCGGDDKGTSGDTVLDACLSPTPPATDGTLDACLDVDPTIAESTTGTGGSGGSGTGSTTSVDIDTGPCLSPPEDGTSTGSSSGTDSGSSSDSGSSDSGGMGNAPAGDSRAAAIERVLSRGSLPADIASRLRSRDQGGS